MAGDGDGDGDGGYCGGDGDVTGEVDGVVLIIFLLIMRCVYVAIIYILYIVIQHIFHILSSNIYYLLQPPWRVGSDGAHYRVGQSWHCKQLASLQSPEEVQSFRYVSNILDADWMLCRKKS